MRKQEQKNPVAKSIIYKGLHPAPAKPGWYQSETSAKPAAVILITPNVLAILELLGYKQARTEFSSIINK